MRAPTTSWWEDVLAAEPELRLPSDADTVIVGAGLVGLGAALACARSRPGERVVLIEQTRPIANASTRNAGFACFGTAGELLADLETEPEAAVKSRIAARWQGLLHLRAEVGDAALAYEPCGGYELFTDAADANRVKAELPWLNRWLADITGEADVYQPTTHLGYPVIANRLEGALHSGRMVAALIDKARGLGVAVHTGQRVANVASGQVTLAEGHVIAARRILLATNAHSDELHPAAADTSVVPGRGVVFVTDPMPEASFAWRGTWHYDRGYVYFRHVDSPEGVRLLLGGGRNLDFAAEASLRPEVNPRIRQWLIDFASEVLRLPAGWRIEREWVGVMGFTASHEPVLREVQPGVWLAAGLGGMGVARGLAFGMQAAARLG